MGLPREAYADATLPIMRTVAAGAAAASGDAHEAAAAAEAEAGAAAVGAGAGAVARNGGEEGTGSSGTAAAIDPAVPAATTTSTPAMTSAGRAARVGNRGITPAEEEAEEGAGAESMTSSVTLAVTS